MNNSTLKEIGKYLVDLSKILFAIVLISPYVNNGKIDTNTLYAVMGLATMGFIFIAKGNR